MYAHNKDNNSVNTFELHPNKAVSLKDLIQFAKPGKNDSKLCK